MRVTIITAILLVATLGVGPTGAQDPVTDVQKFTSCYKGAVEDVVEYADSWVSGTSEIFHEAKCKLRTMPRGLTFRYIEDFEIQLTDELVIPNYANGVIGGRGTYDDPWVIAGHSWDGRNPLSCPAISIEGFHRHHIVIEENWFHAMDCAEGAVQIRDTSAVVIRRNAFTATRLGIHVEDSGWPPLIERNTFTAHAASEDASVAVPAAGTAILVSGGTFGLGLHDVRWNTIRDYNAGPAILVKDASAHVGGNRIVGNSPHALVKSVDSHTTRVTRNHLENLEGPAIDLDIAGQGAYPFHIIDGNRIDEGEIRVSAEYGRVSIGLNTMYGSHTPLIDFECSSCIGAEIKYNKLSKAGWGAYAIRAEGQGTVKQNIISAQSGYFSRAIWLTHSSTSDNTWSVEDNRFAGAPREVVCETGVTATFSGNVAHDGHFRTEGC